MHKIAIVEDAQDNRDFLYYLLREEYQVLRYGSGEEALRDFALQVPDLIVLDIWLPDMDGVEVLKRLRQEDALRNIPAIALTANAMAGDREKYLAVGFNEYVSKPIMDIDGFLSIVRSLLVAS
jgi:two-component system, cell cycle response regulator DivK